MWALILRLISIVGPMLAGPVSQFVTGINIGQVLSAITNNIKKYWKIYLPALLVVVQLLTSYGWYHDHNALVSERASHKADIAAYKQAQQDAQKRADDIKQQLDKQNKVKADEADKNYSNLLAKYRANLMRYKAAQGISSGPSSSEHSEATQGGNGPGGSSDVPEEFLTITLSDAQICATNTARLQATHDWAVTLNEKP